MKGLSEDIDTAKKAINTLGGKVVNDVNYTIPPEDNRRIIVIEKVVSTPKKYPRISGKIKSKPL
jgi:16S rRNA (guanine527-N7)-methyltransferase